MIRFLILGLALTCVLSQSRPVAGQDKEKTKGALKIGDNPPGPFHPYNVTGPWGESRVDSRNKDQDVKGLYHCPVSEYNLDPAILIFVKEFEFKPELLDLLSKLDAAVEKNPVARLHVTATFYSDKLPQIVGGDAKSDDLREELAAKLQKLAADLKLKHVVLCLDGQADLDRYLTDKSADVTVIGYKRFSILLLESLKDKDVAEKIKGIMEAVKTKLGAKRE